jgi:hypothetical protein
MGSLSLLHTRAHTHTHTRTHMHAHAFSHHLFFSSAGGWTNHHNKARQKTTLNTAWLKKLLQSRYLKVFTADQILQVLCVHVLFFFFFFVMWISTQLFGRFRITWRVYQKASWYKTINTTWDDYSANRIRVLWIISFPVFFVRHTSVTRQWLWSWLPLLNRIIYLTYTTMM